MFDDSRSFTDETGSSCYPRRMVKLGGRSVSPVVLIGGVVLLLAVTLAFAVPAFMGGPPRRSSHVAATPIATPTVTVSPNDTLTPTPTVTATVPAEPGPAQGPLGPPPAGAPVPSSPTT